MPAVSNSGVPSTILRWLSVIQLAPALNDHIPSPAGTTYRRSRSTPRTRCDEAFVYLLSKNATTCAGSYATPARFVKVDATCTSSCCWLALGFSTEERRGGKEGV